MYDSAFLPFALASRKTKASKDQNDGRIRPIVAHPSQSRPRGNNTWEAHHGLTADAARGSRPQSPVCAKSCRRLACTEADCMSLGSSQPRADNAWPQCAIRRVAGPRKSFVLQTVGCMRGNPSRKRLFLSLQSQTVHLASQESAYDVADLTSTRGHCRMGCACRKTLSTIIFLIRKSRYEDTSTTRPG